MKPWKIWSKIPVNTLSDALRHLKFFLGLTSQNFGLRRPRGPTGPISCLYFYSQFRKGHHCGNKLFPVSVSVILEKLIQNSSKHALRCATTSQFFFAADVAKIWPPAASRADQAHKLFLFLFPVSQRTPLREQVVSCFCFRNPPPAPMNHVKCLRAGPAEMPFRNCYTANIKHFHLTDSVRWKWKTQPYWVIKPVTSDLVRRMDSEE